MIASDRFNYRLGGCADLVNICNELVAPAMHGFYDLLSPSVVSQDFSGAFDVIAKRGVRDLTASPERIE